MASSDLREFIEKHYGGQAQLARHLGVTAETVRLWLTKNPKPMLKYLPEIVNGANTTEMEVVGEILHHVEQVNGEG